MSSLRVVFALTTLAIAGCESAPQSANPDRGKGDHLVSGSCAASCGEQSRSGNCWCDDSCSDFGDCCTDKAAICESEGFEQFSLFRSGFCAPDSDCTSSIELFADGTLFVDRPGEPSGQIHKAMVSGEDLSSAIAVLTDPALIELLDLASSPCPEPTDLFESMSLTLGGMEHDNRVTLCDKEPIALARDALNRLADKYVASDAFQSFKLFNSGFCAPGSDCTSSIELLADGTLRVDRVGEPSGEIHEATVSQSELTAAIEVLTRRDLIELLSLAEPPCSPPTDIFQSMTLNLGGAEITNSVTFCQDAALVAARDTLTDLAAANLP